MTSSATALDTRLSAHVAHAAATSLRERGYAVLPGLMTPDERSLACRVHDELVAGGTHTDRGDWGYGIHPLLTIDVRLCHLFAHPLLTEISRIVLQDRVVLKHAGSRIDSGGPRLRAPRIPWHNHAFSQELRDLTPQDPRRGQRPRRLLFGWYLDGSSHDGGALTVIPRRWDDPLAPPSTDWSASWDGQCELIAPAGSAILFTSDLWHTATANRTSQIRRLTGGHYQAAGCLEAHSEDQDFTAPAIDMAKTRLPRFAAVLDAR